MVGRAVILGAAAPLGLVVGATLWLGLAHAPGAEGMRPLGARLASLPTPHLTSSSQRDSQIAQVISQPIFSLTAGAGAVADAAIRLEGLIRSPGHIVALIGINGAPSDWLSLGQSRDGVTLVDVGATKVTVDTAAGLKDVELGGAPGSNEVGASAPASMRSPPPPASAPGVPQ